MTLYSLILFVLLPDFVMAPQQLGELMMLSRTWKDGLILLGWFNKSKGAHGTPQNSVCLQTFYALLNAGLAVIALEGTRRFFYNFNFILAK